MFTISLLFFELKFGYQSCWEICEHTKAYFRSIKTWDQSTVSVNYRLISELRWTLRSATVRSQLASHSQKLEELVEKTLALWREIFLLSLTASQTSMKILRRIQLKRLLTPKTFEMSQNSTRWLKRKSTRTTYLNAWVLFKITLNTIFQFATLWLQLLWKEMDIMMGKS